MASQAWQGVEPGDIGFDQGGGAIGFLIRHFSHSPYAHCWVFHGAGDEHWSTAEAYPGGLKERSRRKGKVDRVARVWRNEEERRAILERSAELVGSKYNYRELFRIIHYRVRKSFALCIALFLLVLFFHEPAWSAIALGVLLVYAAIPLKSKLDPKRVICSNHVAQCVLNARPDVELSFEPQAIWPGRLERDLNAITWDDWIQDQVGPSS